MNAQEIISQVLMIVGLLVILVNVITEVIKNIYNFKSTQGINIFVTILSILITVGSFVAYWQIKSLEFSWYIIVSFVIVGFMVAFSAMFGFDKLLKYFEKAK